MRIGVPTEIKTSENRVGITPSGVRSLVEAGHEVVVQAGAGLGSGLSDAQFAAAGAVVEASADAVWAAELILKVKEPLPEEHRHFREGLTLFTYLHLAPLQTLTQALVDHKVRAIAYETIELDDGSLPLLRPMSEVAGRMAIQVGASCLERSRGGKGILLGGVPGTRRGRVLIVGGGIVGTHAARIAVGMGADVTVLDIDHERMAYLEDIFQGSIETLYSNPQNIEDRIVRSDLIVGAVLVTGAKTPILIKREHLSMMEKGTVLVDVAVDQGGCIETCKPTTHENPTYEVDGIVHYCVANMPGAVAQTSTFALTNVTSRYALQIANRGTQGAIEHDPALRKGVNTWDGHCTYQAVAEATGTPYRAIETLIG